MAAGGLCALLALGAACLVASTTPPEASTTPPVVTLKYGALRGRAVERSNRTIFAFEGVPYARPPVGERRFKAPEEVEAWAGERRAASPGPQCLQMNIFSNDTAGDEDCLYLNVYNTAPPETWAGAKRPVVVWLHGGGFVAGSGDMDRLRPDPLLAEGLVFVSINYRLAVLGFLNAEDGEAPGNAGLKDMVLALRWVKDNVAAFGGDPAQVAVAGISAGGAAVHYLMMSPMASGLFARALAMSGSALNPWALQGRPRATALALGARVGCGDARRLVACLRGKGALQLVASKPPEQEGNFLFWKGSFLPSVEAAGSGPSPFLPASPEELLLRNASRVPFMAGVTDAEGLMFYKTGLRRPGDPSEWAEVSQAFDALYTDDLPAAVRSSAAMRRVKEFYLGERNISNVPHDPETRRRFVQMMSDIFFSAGVERAVRAWAGQGAPTFMYEFTYDSPTFDIMKRLFNAPGVPGVAHGGDVTYLFDLSDDLNPTAADLAVKRRHVALIANFLKTGNPTPEGSALPPWPPFSPEAGAYAEVGERLAYQEHALGRRAAFWRELLAPAGAAADAGSSDSASA